MDIAVLGSSAFGAALAVGFRHGFDWDHVAALGDLTGSQPSARRSMWLATLYALGHACMVLALGAAAIVFAARVPAPVDAAMDRVVGATLIALAAWIAWTALRTRGALPLRSRWMLLVSALRRVLARRRTGEVVVIEHSHPHDHRSPVHDHPHLGTSHESDASTPAGVAVALTHAHRHRHVALAPADPFLTYGSWSSLGIGALHGLGAETPTQILVLTAAAQARSTAPSIGLLVCFVLGLLAANTVIAVAGTLGFQSVLRHRAVAIALAAATATFSLVIGLGLLTS